MCLTLLHPDPKQTKRVKQVQLWNNYSAISLVVWWQEEGSKSLIMELGQFVTRDNHMLHPLFGYHHQVSDTPADVVSAHGQSESCEQGGMKQREEEEEKRKQEKTVKLNKQRHSL